MLKKLFVVLLILFTQLYSVKAQTENLISISDIALHIGVNKCIVENKDVSNAINLDAEKNHWKTINKISDDRFGFSLGTTIGINRNLKISLTDEYTYALVSTNPTSAAQWSGNSNDQIDYLYSRWSTTVLCQYHYEIIKGFFSFYGAIGPNFDRLKLKKRSSLFNNSALIFNPDSSRIMAKTNTCGIRFALATQCRFKSNTGLELSVFKDILLPRKANGIKLDYNLLAVELKLKFYLGKFARPIK
jgi:hypothetical protein